MSSSSTPPPRQRLVAGAADMIRRRGLGATSVRDLAKHSGAPLGSTYHYFPGGKEQLATEAIRYAGDTVVRVLSKRLEAGPVEGLHAFLTLWRRTITDTDFDAGCPVVAVAVEDDGAVGAVAAEVFTSWEKLLADSLRQHGAAKREAEQLATLIVAAVEGAVVMCRAKRSAQPLDAITPQLEALVAAAISR
jgi:AcrR family transcriptional regulator